MAGKRFAFIIVSTAFKYDEVNLLTYRILLVKIASESFFVCFLLRSGFVSAHFGLERCAG
ncbi:hypothetical protein HSB1_39050 [Halogranum salarium B-1]|uniref:Uncharacterized protein n=1 Tax=Halogranum salarium B-1 TaxID=1210908 RepID=J3EU16_9EURY|nr:hypothetical protein HSB1_39050 [Halogranum salarium B-1]